MGLPQVAIRFHDKMDKNKVVRMKFELKAEVKSALKIQVG